MTNPGIDRQAVWAQVLEIYAVPGVQPACLFFQDVLGVDVTLLLFSLALGRCRRQPLDKSDIADADRLVGHWRMTVVQPLRGIRKTLKNGIDPIPKDRSEPMRETIKRAELSAEEIEFEILANCYADRHPLVADLGWATPAITAIISHFSGDIAPDTSDEHANAVAAIAHAAEFVRPENGK